MGKKQLITGITGQDGYYLTKLLLSKGYDIYGIIRRNSQKSYGTLQYLSKKEFNKLHLYYQDMIDQMQIQNVVKEIQPDELYHLAQQSFVQLSFKNPEYTYKVNIEGTLNVQNQVKEFSPNTKVYFAQTSEMFGRIQENPQKETTPFYPMSPYATTKVQGFWTMVNYRESYGLFMSNGILFNHMGPGIRGLEFVTRKITNTLQKIKYGKQNVLELGNIYSKRDWGYAGDYVKAMWMILQHDKPDNFIIQTNETHSVKEFVEITQKYFGFELIWKGKGINEIAVDKKSNRVIIKINKDFYRPNDVKYLQGDYSKQKNILGWQPTTTFKELIYKMCKQDEEIVLNLMR